MGKWSANGRNPHPSSLGRKVSRHLVLADSPCFTLLFLFNLVILRVRQNPRSASATFARKKPPNFHTMAASTSQKPGVLMLGIVHHAKAEFEKLSEVADVVVCFCFPSLTHQAILMKNSDISGILQQVTTGTRDEFIRDCDNGKYDDVVAISRTYDSVKVCLLLRQDYSQSSCSFRIADHRKI